jgi:hypothetical protein
VTDAASAVNALNRRLADFGTVAATSAVQAAILREQWRNFTEELGVFTPYILTGLKALATGFLTIGNVIATAVQGLGILGRALVANPASGDLYERLSSIRRSDGDLWGEESTWGKMMQGFWYNKPNIKPELTPAELMRQVQDEMLRNRKAEDESKGLRDMRGELFDLQQGRGWGNIGWMAEDTEDKTGERLRQIYDAQTKLRVQKWDEAHREMFRISDTFTSTVGGLMERMLSGSKITFQDIASAFRSMVARMLTDLAMSRLTDWFNTAINAGKFGGGARPGGSFEYGGSVTGGSFGGARPVGGGAPTLVLSSSPSGDIIERLYYGASLASRRKVGRGVILDGSRLILRTS